MQASTFGIEIAPSCKALYRRARALSEPMTASDDDTDAAIRDLADAAARQPLLLRPVRSGNRPSQPRRGEGGPSPPLVTVILRELKSLSIKQTLNYT